MPEQLFYGLALLLAITGLMIIDHRFKLAYFCNRRATILTVLIGVVVFSIWDVLGVSLGIFFHGGSPYTLSARLLPEFPLEELLFLTLLSYNALLIYRGVTRS